MKKTLRRVVLFASLFAIALVSTISFAAWSGYTKKAGNSITTASLNLLSFDNETAITAITDLAPYDQSGLTFDVGTGKTDALRHITLTIPKTDAVINYAISVSDFTATGFNGEIRYATTKPASKTEADAITNKLANSVEIATGSTSTSADTTVNLYVWMYSTDNADMGKTITFSLNLVDKTV